MEANLLELQAQGLTPERKARIAALQTEIHDLNDRLDYRQKLLTKIRVYLAKSEADLVKAEAEWTAAAKKALHLRTQFKIKMGLHRRTEERKTKEASVKAIIKNALAVSSASIAGCEMLA